MNESKRIKLSSKFDEKVLQQRTIIRRGKEVVLDYVPGNKITERLNDCFGGEWDFEVKDRIVDIPNGQVAVLGKLTVSHHGLDYESSLPQIEPKVDNSRSCAKEFISAKLISTEPRFIIKEQWGGSYIARSNNGRVCSLGDDLKIATTDALKKCATLLGVALYLYEQDDQGDEEAIIIPGPEEKTTKDLKSKITKKEPVQKEELCTEKQIAAILKVLAANNLKDVDVLKSLKIKSLSELSQTEAGSLITQTHAFWLQEKQ